MKNKILKSIVVLILSVAILINFVACGDSESNKGKKNVSAGTYGNDSADINSNTNNNGETKKDLNLEIIEETISVGTDHAVGIKADGTVIATGSNEYGQCDVNEWSDIVAVAAGGEHTVGLKSDGTVVAIGNNRNGQCDVSSWTDIVSVKAGYGHTLGLKSDGTVVAVGLNNYQQAFTDKYINVVQIYAQEWGTLVIKSNGMIQDVDLSFVESRDDEGWESWTDVSKISGSVIALKKDGTVVADCHNNEYGQCNVEEWTDIVDIATGTHHTVGLKSDGTVVAVGRNIYGQCNVEEWTDIIAVFDNEWATIGLKSDGTVVYTGSGVPAGVEKWTDMKIPE